MPNPDGILRSLQKSLGIWFKNPDILKEALTHRSFLNENESLRHGSYERLEYLGDAFLGWVVATELYEKFPEYDEGALTLARSQLVRGEQLAQLARSIELGSYLNMGQGEEKSGGRDRNSTLAAALEALIAAIVIDQGETKAYRLISSWINDDLESFEAQAPKLDSKSNLQELLQEKGLPLPVYSIFPIDDVSDGSTFFASVTVEGEEIGTGSGKKKNQAEQQAAFNALKRIKQ